ncbi:MAG TPA: M20/M25/M40 family metallo-hydrolase [Cyclobacteriaceae bacterium]|nr:M20/M25/M40 family metallo-hydrolase [Cyclobacteriaceae bacterium]
MRFTLILLCLLAFQPIFSQTDANRIKSHISALADDAMMGRGTGTEGEKMAAAYIESEFRKLKLKPLGDKKTYFQAFEFKSGVHGEGEKGTARNIAAFLDNGAENTIIIGAHYDHLGLGLESGSLEANSKGKIHNGADDNASGVAGILELARYFKNNSKKEKNNFLFLCFSGEELGLYGSKHYADYPTIDLAKADFMINLDMVGRLNEKNGLQVSGSGTAAGWENLLKGLSTDALPIKTDSSGTGPSDHTSFYLKNVPVLHFFTGSHNDYHKTSDDTDKINAEGEARVLDIIIKVIESADNEPKLAFLKTKSKPMNTRSSFKVTLGVMPSYTSDEAGLKVDGVSDGKPAQKAGIQAGDVITQIGDFPIKDIQAYMEALGKFEKGQTVSVTLKRSGETKTVQLTF